MYIKKIQNNGTIKADQASKLVCVFVWDPKVGIYKRKQELDQKSDQENKKKKKENKNTTKKATKKKK